jgi:hypothetical protein
MKMGRRPSRGCGIGYVPHHFYSDRERTEQREYKNGAGCALLAPCRRPILIATKDMLISGTGH